MTISTTTNRVTYTGNGVTVAFSFPYAFFAQADLVVIETVIATGVQTTKTITTHYTISGSVDALGHYSSGGTVTAVTAPASTVTWTIYRDPAATQTTDLVENDPMPAESLEAALDYQTMLNQRTRDIAARSLQQPEGDSATIDRLPSKVARASHYLAFDSDGDPVAVDPTVSTAVPDLEWVLRLDDYASLSAAVTAAGSTVYTLLITNDSTVSDDVTIPSTLTLWFVGQGKLTIDSGKTVTINGPLMNPAGLAIFGGSGVATITSDQNFTQNGALVHRLVDKVAIGGAATSDFAYPNVTQDWMTASQVTQALIKVVGTVGSGVTTSGSPIVTFTAGGITPTVGAYFFAFFGGVPVGAKVLTVDSATQITLDANCTASTTGNTFRSSDGSVLGGSPISSVCTALTNTSTSSAFGGVFGSQSANFASSGTSCIGVFGYAENNHASLATSCWGGYFEAHRVNSTVGGARGIEIDVTSCAASEIKPNAFQQSSTATLQLGAGSGKAGELTWGTQVNVGAAIQIVGNPMKFRTGIMFSADSIEGTDGVTLTSAGRAIAMAPGHYLEWHNQDEDLVGRIGCANTDSTAKTELRFTSLGVQFLGESNQALGYWFNVASAVNYPTMNASVTGQPVMVAAAGSDTNIDLRLFTKGTGVVRFGTHAAITTETLSGYITIKDAGGTSRKVAVVS